MIRTTCLRCGKSFKDCDCSSYLGKNILNHPYEAMIVGTPTVYETTVTGDTGVGFVIDDELTELIKAVRNRCDVVLTLIEHYGTERLIPTVLEDLYTDAQTIVDNYCVKDEAVQLSHCTDNPFDCLGC